MTTFNPNVTSWDDPSLPNATRGVAWWEANMGALRRLQALENEGLEATADEQWGLKGYSGFGGAEFAEDFNLDTDSSA